MNIQQMKPRALIKNTLFTIVAIIFLYSAIGKLLGREAITSLFAPLGMTDYIIRIALVQLIIVGCLMWKPLRSLGVLIASAFLGGVIFMMMATDNSPLSATITLLVVWVAYKLEWWGYWNHYTDDETVCGCGWCAQSKQKHRHEFVTDCDCKDNVCKC